MTVVQPLARIHSPASLSDGDLVTSCRAGDETAWSVLVHRHSPRLRAIARGQGLDLAAAEDAVQATWSNLYRSIDRIEDGEAVRGWLATTVRREAIRLSKRQRRALVMVEREAETPAVDERVLVDETVHAVRHAFAQLRSSDRHLLGLLFGGEDRSYVEIAAITGYPVGSIGPTRARALQRLSRVLGDVA
jgi:RNA polymerase sigma factor (sigma-70 family)